MLSRFPIFYIQRLVILLMSGLVIVAGVLTFGNAEIFAHIFLLTLVGLTIHFFNDKNLASIFIIIAAGRVYEEIVWVIMLETYAFKIIVYTLASFVLCLLRYDIMAKLALICLMCICGAEIYWYSSGYSNTPNVAWYVILIVQDVVIRHFLFMRPVALRRFSTKMISLPLDLQLYNVSGLFVIAYILLVFEYFLRHIFNIPSLLVFAAHPYVAHTLGCAMLWFILNYAIKRSSLFRA